jgi:bifunctional enzyme CysN/CysC
VRWQQIEVDGPARAKAKGQRACCLWLTGLSGAGKSTIANALEKRLHAMGQITYVLDGDNVRHGLNRDLGFTDADRVENIRRIAEVARLMVDAGLIAIVAAISPFGADWAMARELFPDGAFIEVFVDIRQRAVRQGAGWPDPELHRSDLALRAAAGARAASR